MTSITARSRRLFSFVRRHPGRSLALALLAGFFAFNALAYQHAHAMLHFSSDGARTPPPQALSLGGKILVLCAGVRIPRPSNERSPADFSLPSEIVHVNTDDGVRLEGWLLKPAHPRGTILMFHGYSAARSSLLEQGKACYNLGFATVLLDFRGSGGSDGNATSVGFHEAEDVAAAVRYVSASKLPRPLILYGQSMGAAAILRSIATLEVRPDAIILEAVFDRMLQTVRNRFGLMGIPSFPAAELLTFWGGVQSGFSGFEHNPVSYAPSCKCPVLMLHGADDQHAKANEGRDVFEQLRGSKELIVFQGAGHTSLLGSAPERWRKIVREYLEKQVQATQKRGRGSF